jgi:GNAT superfamily N-acetyltransferase/RNA:NAD 2'-phosphotransferase (TPT1/KptA family)
MNPYDQSREDFAGKWHEEETPEQARVRYHKRMTWEQSVLAAVSTGDLTAHQAFEKGLLTAGEVKNFKLLPATLYHVTTAASAVRSHGLKTRFELGQSSGQGLGGGTDLSISLTDDLSVATQIYNSMVVARKVASGEFTLDEMIAAAEKGTGASRPWLDDVIKSYGGQNQGKHEFDCLRRGVVHERSALHGEAPKDAYSWKPAPNSPRWVDDAGKERITDWERPMTESELQEARFNFFKKWSFFREHAGGEIDPLYFMTDVPGLSRVPESEIALLTVAPMPGAMGTQESGLKEWRVYSGDALRIVSTNKTADVPATLSVPQKSVSPEYDAVKVVLRWFDTNDIESLSWKEFQRNFQQYGQKYPTLFTDIRGNRPRITREDLQKYLNDYKGWGYDVTTEKYQDATHSYRDVEQLVLQLNRGASAAPIISGDPLLEQYLDMVSQSSAYSGHPVGENTVGWLRVDFVNKEWLLVDEVQSDLINSVTQAMSIVATETYEEFLNNIENEIVKNLMMDKVTPQRYTWARRQFIQSGYTAEKLTEIKAQLTALFKGWAEHALATIIEIARRHGIENVAIHSVDTISQRDQSVEGTKVKMYYDNLAKSFGFKKERLEGSGLNGEFWVRKTSAVNDAVVELSDEEDDDFDYEAENQRILAALDEQDERFEQAHKAAARKLDLTSASVVSAKIASMKDDVGWFTKSARPTQQKIELLQKQLKLTPEQIEECIKADPSPNQSDYVAWLGKWLAKGAFQLPEDAEKLRGQLDTFQKLKKSPNFTFSKDIQQYDPVKLFETLQEAEQTGMGSKKEEQREKVRKGAEVVVREGDILIYKVTSPQALSELSGGTNWCTAQAGTAGGYLKNGPSYVFFDAGSAVAQLHPASNQFMNRQDFCILESVTGDERNYRTEKRFLADPALAKALSLLAAQQPDVKEWVKTHVADPEDVKKILGEAATREVKDNAEYEKALIQYQKDLKKYEKQQKILAPKYEKYREDYEAYEQAYDDWSVRKKRGEDVGESPKPPARPESLRMPTRPGYNYYNYGRPEKTKTYSMQVRNALATGQPLSPETEQQLINSDVTIPLLLKYGSLFHPGQPWEPLASAILTKVYKDEKVSKDAIDYAVKFVKGRWPAIEPYLLKKLFLVTRNMENMRTALDYAIRAYKTRWPEFEQKIQKAKPGTASGLGAAEYAIRVLKQPWSALPDIKRKKNGKINAEECMIIGNPDEARRYAATFPKLQNNRWNEFEESALKANNLVALIDYAATTLKTRMPELEEKILSGAKDTQEHKGRSHYRTFTDLPLTYALKVIKGRWPEYEKEILTYQEEKSGRSSEYKPSHGQANGYYYSQSSRLNKNVANYIQQVIRGRWPEFEKMLLERYEKHPEMWATNQDLVDGYLVTIDGICKERLPEPPLDADEMPDTRSTYEQLHNPRPIRDERKQKPYTKFTQDPQCYWPEGEQRLVTRDPGYEEILVNELRERTKPKDAEGTRDWGADNKYVAYEDLVKMEKAPPKESDFTREEGPSYTIWNGIWIGWYGMDKLEKYLAYMLANNQVWPLGVDIMEISDDIQDVHGRYGWDKRVPRRQPETQVQSSLNKVTAAYTAYVVSEPSHAAILAKFPPKFPDVFAHHVTCQFGVPEDSDAPQAATVKVVGYAADDSLEALVVEVNGTTQRPDGKTYHITLSLDRSQGRKPVDSNKVIAANGFTAVEPMEVQVTPELIKQGAELDDPYVYHVTPQGNLKNIEQEGLKREKGYTLFDDMQKATHFTDAEGLDFWINEVGDYYGRPVAVVKVPKSKLDLKQDEFGSEDAQAPAYRVEHDVEPSDITFVKTAAKVHIDYDKDMYKNFKFKLDYSYHDLGDPTDEDREIGSDNWNLLIVYAFDTTKKEKGMFGRYAGAVEFVLRNGFLQSCNTSILPEYRRQGLATAMYTFAEGSTGLETIPHSSQSSEGNAFWRQKDRPFGKNSSAAQRWYHGTSKANAEKIIADGYLVPGMDSTYMYEDIPREDAVYITCQQAIAEGYAIDRNNGVVLEVAVPDPQNLLPDEDSIHDALRMGKVICAEHEDVQLGQRIRDLWLKKWNDEVKQYNANGDDLPLMGSFEEAWEAWGEIPAESMAEIGEQMKEMAEYIRDNDPALSRQIIAMTCKAAHIGKLKVVGSMKHAAKDRELRFDQRGQLLPLANIPNKLYHQAPVSARENIKANGLIQPVDDDGEGGIYFSSYPPIGTQGDVWEVDVRGLKIEPDDTTPFFNTDKDIEAFGAPWWVYWNQGNIPPSRLNLMTSLKHAARDGEPFNISVYEIVYDDSPHGYSVKYPALESQVKILSTVGELKRFMLDVAARYDGKYDALVTFGFSIPYGLGEEPKIRGLKQFEASQPILTRKEPKTANKTATLIHDPKWILRNAQFYEDIGEEDAEGVYIPAKDLEWEAIEGFELKNIGNPTNFDWAVDEVRTVGDEDFTAAIRNQTIEPIIVAQGEDGLFYLWDGNHRVGWALEIGVDVLPAYVGFKREPKTHSFKSALLRSKTAIEIVKNIPKDAEFSMLAFEWQNEGNAIKWLGNIGGFEVSKTRTDRGLDMIRMIDLAEKQTAFYLVLSRKGWIDNVAARQDYQGKGLATMLYAWLLQKGIYKSITSGLSQTKGGRQVWEQLARTSGIMVYGWDIVDRKAFSLDPFDLNSEEPVYDDDLRDEIKYLESEGSWTAKELDVLHKELNPLQDAADPLRYVLVAVKNKVKLASAEYPTEEIRLMAQKWLGNNYETVMSSLEDMVTYEVGLVFYTDPSGKLMTTDLVQGDEAEVILPDVPQGCTPVGSLHTHGQSLGELSDFDREEGQRVANETNTPHFMFVIGDDGEGGLMMDEELFEPEEIEPEEVEKQAGQVLYIEVPKSERNHFWEDKRAKYEFWAFKNSPRALIGEQIIFTFDKKPVATAVVSHFEEPGKSKCDSTGRFEDRHKVFWDTKTFRKYKTADASIY